MFFCSVLSLWPRSARIRRAIFLLAVQAEKLVDFRNIVLNYVEQQIEFQRQVEATWKKLLPELSAAQ